MCLCASGEEADDGAVDGHGLVGLVLDGEGVGHADPGKEEAFVEDYCLLEVLASHFVLFAVEVVGAYCEPADGVGGVVFDEVVGAVVELSGEGEVEEAGGVDGEYFEAEGVLFDGFEAEFVGGWDLVVLVECFCAYAKDVCVLSCY